MYVLVENDIEKVFFKTMFKEITREFQFSYNEPTGKEERYLLLKRPFPSYQKETLEYEEYLIENSIGTVEVNPFIFGGHSIVQKYTVVDLASHPKVKGYESETYEIGKLCIHKDYRNVGYFKNLLVMIYEHSNRMAATQYIGTMVIPLFNLFKEQFEESIEQIGPPDDDLFPGIPFLIDANKMKENERFQRLIKRYLKVLV